MGESPFGGLRVLELGGGVSGPYCALQLADLGADVIKIEPPGGDPVRGWGPPFVGSDAAVFLSLNQSKRSLAIDLEDPAARDAVRALARRADVIIEDLGPAEAARLGLGYEDLAPAQPGLVYCAITPFGEAGPLAGRPGAELVVQAMAEYPSSLGRIGEPPVRVGADIAGINTGVLACQAIAAALFHRRTAGVGQRVGVSQLGSLIHLRGILWNAISDPDEWWGFHCDSYVKPPDHGYQTADRPIYFSLGRGDSEDWDQILIELGMTDVLADERFAHGGRAAISTGRFAHETKPRWEEAFADKTAEEVLDILTRHHCNAVPMHDYPGLIAHPQVQHLGIVEENRTTTGETYQTVRSPWQFGDFALSPRRPAPALGADGRRILAEAGLDAGAIDDLSRRGALTI
ncbi:MAG TPA: CoA transferase [Dehalococcoidia bacterium]|nr:CoA transferase [Dehalococcoidia bacterium]